MITMDPNLADALVFFETDRATPGSEILGTDTGWTEVEGILSIGAVGVMASPKDKTTLKDTVKKYGSAMPDTPDKDIKMQYYKAGWSETGGVPTGAEDIIRANQAEFRNRAKLRENVRMKARWPKSGLEAIFDLALLGFQLDETTSEDWQMATVKAKQSGEVIWLEPEPVVVP